MNDVSSEANEYFADHLADDPVTTKMLQRLRQVERELEDAGLERVFEAAKAARALELGDADTCAELPFDLDDATCEIIDGSQTKGALEEHCSSAETRHAAAVLNTVRRVADEKPGYAWADEILRESPLKTYAQVSLSVVDDELSELALALDRELSLLPRLEERRAADSDREFQTVFVPTLVIFWAEDGQIHCGMSERYGARWAQVARFANERGYPVHTGFRGEPIDEAQLQEMFAVMEE